MLKKSLSNPLPIVQAGLMVDYAKGHYNWFSQTTNQVKENNTEIDKDSHFTIKKKVKPNYETGLINALKSCITEREKINNIRRI